MKRFALLVVLAACTEKTPATTPNPVASVSTPATVSVAPVSTGQRDPRIPPGSGDYSAVLADVEAYRASKIDYATLEKRVLARKLPPHPAGCPYLMTPSPMPPPGVKFDQWMMPSDWEHNFGEVVMTYWVGRLPRADLDKLHAAAHPNEPPLPK